MHKKYQAIWRQAVKYLQEGVRKDFVLHTKNVVKAMELITRRYPDIDKEKMIIAAILHDVGWAHVPKDIQIHWDKGDNKRVGEELHIKHAEKIIKNILRSFNYSEKYIKEIIQIVQSHKSANPKTIEEKLLIDADNLSDIFQDAILSDAKQYGKTPLAVIGFREGNIFHTEAARKVFQAELAQRKEEFNREWSNQ